MHECVCSSLSDFESLCIFSNPSSVSIINYKFNKQLNIFFNVDNTNSFHANRSTEDRSLEKLMEIILSKSFYSIIKYNDLTAVIRNIIPGG